MVHVNYINYNYMNYNFWNLGMRIKNFFKPSPTKVWWHKGNTFTIIYSVAALPEVHRHHSSNDSQNCDIITLFFRTRLWLICPPFPCEVTFLTLSSTSNLKTICCDLTHTHIPLPHKTSFTPWNNPCPFSFQPGFVHPICHPLLLLPF